MALEKDKLRVSHKLIAAQLVRRVRIAQKLCLVINPVEFVEGMALEKDKLRV